MILTIDGPAGTGKTTVARGVARRLGLPYFDTGAMYRAVAYLMLEQKVPLSDEPKIRHLLREMEFEIRGERYFAQGRDVTESLRTQAVGTIVSPVSALPIVREALWKIQREFAEHQGGVFEGRDMGSEVFPDAEVKIFLTARPEVRAARRYEELLRKQPGEAAGLTQQQVLADLKRRDEIDSSRMLAPLICPRDAYVIDTSNLSIDEVIDRIVEYRIKKRKRPSWMQWGKIKLLYRAVVFGAWVVGKLLYRHKVYGLEHYYPRGAIIAANHTSVLDPPILAVSWPEEVHFLAKASLFEPLLFGALIRGVNSHPVKGTAADFTVFKTVCELLEEGKKVVLFPEGMRTDGTELGPFRGGIGRFVARTGTAIIPAYIEGPDQIWGRHRRFPKLRGRTICVFGRALQWDAFAHLGKEEGEAAMSRELREAILGLKEWLRKGAKGVP